MAAKLQKPQKVSVSHVACFKDFFSGDLSNIISINEDTISGCSISGCSISGCSISGALNSGALNSGALTVEIQSAKILIAYNSYASLTSVKIPQNVTTIADFTFNYCKSMKAITFDSNKKHFKAQDGILFDIQIKTLGACPTGTNLTHYQIPNSITTIESSGFSVCTSLTSITIGINVLTIELNPFQSCTSLIATNLSLKVTLIQNIAFSGCTNLDSIYIWRDNGNFKNRLLKNAQSWYIN